MRTPLSPREKEVANLLRRGYVESEIAKKLCISPRTVQTYRTNIMQKWHIKSRRELVALMDVDENRGTIIIVPSDLINDTTTIMVGEL